MTATDVTVVESDGRVDLGVVQARKPAELVSTATAAADALAGVIDAKKLYNTINGRRYVRVEGWTTLAAMLGCLPREVSVDRHVDGTYTATVELARMSDGAILTRASAECGMDEELWAKRADYARRSMAVTRATSKACRIAFSWVMVLAGYEVVPAEEVPPGGFQGKDRAPEAKPEGNAAVWPWGVKKGTPLADLTSDELVSAKAWIAKSGKGKDLAPMIDDILEGRRGE